MAKKVDYKKLYKEVGKEVGRWLLAAVLPSSLAYFANLDAEWAVYAMLFLRLVDRIVHLAGKELKNETLILGLARF